jgi:hypothetical protein
MLRELLTSVARAFDTCQKIVRHLSKVHVRIVRHPEKMVSRSEFQLNAGVEQAARQIVGYGVLLAGNIGNPVVAVHVVNA